MKAVLTVALAILAVTVTAGAQQPATPFKSGIEAVYLDVTVLDRDNAIVTGLTKDDFEIFDDGVKHDVAIFSSDPARISIGVLIDASNSMNGERFAAARLAAAAVGRALTPQDLWSVSAFSDFRRPVIGWRPYDESVMSQLMALSAGGGTELYKSVADMVSFMRETPHRKRAMLVITDGADNAVVFNRRQASRPMGGAPDQAPMIVDHSGKAMDALRTGEVLLYALGLNWPSQSGPVHVPSLLRLAEPTGGAVAVASTMEDVEQAARRLAEELRQQYTLGFYPQKAADGKFRRLKVVAKNPAYRIRTRAGYLATKAK